MHEVLIDELCVFLDARQAEFLATLDRLGALRAAIIRRDEAVLGELLDAVRQDGDHRRRMETAQAALEERLLAAIDGLCRPVTLSRVCDRVDAALREPLRHKQALLLETSRRVQNELEATEMLLRECARCNRELLGAILGRNQQSLTYDPQGQSQWNVHRGLVSMTL